MSEQSKTTAQQTLGLIAEFEGPNALKNAARAARDERYAKVNAFSPFPIHGMDEALGIRPSRLPWLVLIAGVVAGLIALAGQWWTNAVDYAYLISGKPPFSLPANIPVTFEVIILAAAFAAFFGTLALNGLPRLSNPLLKNDRFRRATSDGFFLSVELGEDGPSPQGTSEFLHSIGATYVESIQDFADGHKTPRFVYAAAVVLASLALLPPLLIARARATTSDQPRLSIISDMDYQPTFKAQTTSQLFSDRRAMRPPVAGTVARGELRDDDHLHLGLDKSNAQRPGIDPSGEPEWSRDFPFAVTREVMERGQLRYNIHCAVCHGQAGDGDGIVSMRAIELGQGTWVPPTSIHAEHVREQPVGQLFNTITNGVRKMPAYAEQIRVEDRWAIVAYLRALQRSQNASIDDVPAELQSSLREMN